MIENFQFTYEQWQGGRLSRIEVADFEILTPWETSGDGEEWNRILIDPGVVFGNGLHPTTQDCLRALVYAADKRPFERVLDLGTGTGILSVAAALLGASEVLAVDLNPLCAKTAKRNAELNHQKEKIEVVEGSAEGFFDKAADLVVANIHYEVIQKLLKARRFCPKERLVVSGLMRSQVRDVKEQMGRSRINVVKEWDRDMTWFTILAEIG